MTIFGWDASDFDWDRGPMDLGAAVRDGIVFFTHKATEGTRTRHVHYGEAMRRARSAGMPLYGAYVVPRTPGNGGHGTIAQQVDYYLSYLDSQTPWWRSLPEFFHQVDSEHWGYDDVSPALGAQMCSMLRAKTGQWVVHYAPRWGYGNTIPGSDPLWASSYGSNPAVPYRHAYPGDNSSGWAPYSGRTPTFLQFGSKARIGSQPACDINAYRGSLDQLRAMITGGTMATLDDVVLGIDGNRRSYSHMLQDLHNELILGADYGAGGVSGRINKMASRVDALQVPGAPTDAQVDAAILKAMLNPEVQKGIGDAIAAHLHVS